MNREEGSENLAVERESKAWGQQQLAGTCTLLYRFQNKFKPPRVPWSAASCLQDDALNLPASTDAP